MLSSMVGLLSQDMMVRYYCPAATACVLILMLAQLLWTLNQLSACWLQAQPGGSLPDPGMLAAGELGADRPEAQNPSEDLAEITQRNTPEAARRPPAAVFGLSANLARVYVINVDSATSRWQHMEASLGGAFGVGGLPQMQRYKASTPLQDGCDLPYSLSDCCTVSHMSVLQNFSADVSVRDDHWVLILEDDIALHPEVMPQHLGEVIGAGLAKAESVMSPFVYFGLCNPVCSGPQAVLQTPSDATVSFRSHCSGSCTHAYAVQKFIAPYVPRYLQRMKNRARTIDAALSLMATGLNMSLLGSSLSSPDIRAAGSLHAGIFYMKGFSDSLTTSFEWDTRLKVHFRLVDWSGRIGNLMFQWAALVGMAAKAQAETEAYFPLSEHRERVDCPAVAFFRHFRLQRFSRDLADLKRANEKPKDHCSVLYKEAGPNLFREDDMHMLFSEVSKIRRRNLQAEPEQQCKTIEVLLQGYFQSWKYFKNFEPQVRRAYEAPPAVKAKAEAWLLKTRRALEHKVTGSKWLFVGVQVRRGDKVHNPSFSGVYYQTDWGYFRFGMRLVSKRLRKSAPNRRIGYIVTAGGSMNSNAQDIQEAKQALKSVSEHVVFTESGDPFIDHAILAMSDGIVISPGSFGWWAAYISPAGQGKGLVIAPQYLYQKSSTLSQGYAVKDYYPPNWEVVSNDATDAKT